MKNGCHDNHRQYRKGYLDHMKYNAKPADERPPVMDSNDLEDRYGSEYCLGWFACSSTLRMPQKTLFKKKERRG